MPCYHPLRGVLLDSPNGAYVSFNQKAFGKGLTLPCGRCIGCRLERVRQWAARLTHEAECYDDACFVTLTYRDEDLPGADRWESGTLDKIECQKFMKRLRSRIAPKKIKFFLSGEYGDLFDRAHYHAIIFGYSFPDKVLWKRTPQGSYFTSEELDETWGHGFTSLGDVSFESCAYVAKYALKKITNEKGRVDAKGNYRPSIEEHYRGRTPEFVHMSRGGRSGRGIGFEWLHSYCDDVYPADEIISRGYPSKPPRYYDKVFSEAHPEAFEEIKKKREIKPKRLYNGSEESLNAGRLATLERVAEAKLKNKRGNKK